MENPFEIIFQELVEIKQMLNSLGSSNSNSIEIINRDELLKRLQITEPTAIIWGKRGKIPEIRIGSSVRYNWPEVVKALESEKRAYAKAYKKKEVDTISDNYAKHLLRKKVGFNIQSNELGRDLIISQRRVIELKRKIKNSKNE